MAEEWAARVCGWIALRELQSGQAQEQSTPIRCDNYYVASLSIGIASLANEVAIFQGNHLGALFLG